MTTVCMLFPGASITTGVAARSCEYVPSLRWSVNDSEPSTCGGSALRITLKVAVPSVGSSSSPRTRT